MTIKEIIERARDINRPKTTDYINILFDEFIELHGDRLAKDDKAIIGGLAKFKGRKVIIVGHNKGHTTEENITCNFGMPTPEGYRKAIRIMQLSSKFKCPVITFIDTPGAYPGKEAEEHGIAHAISECILNMFNLAYPTISVVIGEGGSGGALAIGATDRILMLEYAIYSVISPEGAAAILWREESEDKIIKAAEALKLTAPDLYKLNIIDEIIKEPEGGAHNDHEKAASYVEKALEKHLSELEKIKFDELKKMRYNKYRKMGILLR